MRFSLPKLLLAAATGVSLSRVGAQYPSPNQVLVTMQPRFSGSYLGVGLLDIDAERATVIHLGEVRGVEVMRVEDGGPAEEAGIRVGDVLLSYNGETILGAQQVGRLVAETPVNRKIKIEYWRAGKQFTAFATTGSIHFGAGVSEVPEMHSKATMDIPDSLLIWKSGALGIVSESLEAPLAQYFGVKQGVLIRAVEEDSPGGRAGVRAGDVITAIGDRAVSSPRDVSSYLRMERHRGVKSISLELTRDHKPKVVKISFADGPE